MVHHCAPIMPF